MLAGGGTALLLIVGDWSLPGGLEAGAFGIAASLVVYLLLSGWKRGAGPAAG
jgi:hypothetical protein